jgi:hypothetical protein
MKKNRGRPEFYEVTPWTMVIPSVPRFAGSVVPDDPPETEGCCLPDSLPVVGMNFECQIGQVREESETLLRRCRVRLRRGDATALTELLDANPHFILVPWVAEELVRRRDAGLLLRRRGRPRGGYEVHPLTVIGLVHHLIRTRRAKNKDEAFGELEALGLLKRDVAQRGYYRALSNRNIRPLFFEHSEETRQVPAAEFEAFLASVRWPKDGEKLRSTRRDPELGEVHETLAFQESGRSVKSKDIMICTGSGVWSFDRDRKP